MNNSLILNLPLESKELKVKYIRIKRKFIKTRLNKYKIN